MNTNQTIFEMIVFLGLGALLVWGFASGSEYSWGWKAIVYFGELTLQMQGA